MVIFESGSKLSRIERFAFWKCSSLSAICIPCSVEKILEGCFSGCGSLSTVTFEHGSKLSCVERSSFSHCSSLSAIYIPSALRPILHEYQLFLSDSVNRINAEGVSND
jgi:hypothetical protein